jgi:hypothetical protein
MEILTRRQLDPMRCDVDGCTHQTHPHGLGLHARCHPSAPLQVWYAEGVLTVLCAGCKTVVARIAVAAIYLGVVH